MEFNVNNTFFTGKFLLHLPSVDSTNNYAKEYIANSSPIDGTVILAEEQTAGRGQAGNTWESDANKNLTFSLIYHTSFLKATEQFYLNMAVSLGVWSLVNSQWSMVNGQLSAVIDKLGEEDKVNKQPEPFTIDYRPSTKIKWPNDIIVDEKKIAGILIENTISGMLLKYSVIGIGLNVNQTIFPEGIKATSLHLILSAGSEKNKLLNELLSSIEGYFLLLKERKFEVLKKKYLENLYRFNEKADYIKNGFEFSGRIKDINESGHLIMETDKGIEKFGFKEIVFN